MTGLAAKCPNGKIAIVHNQQSKVSTTHQKLQDSALLLQRALDGLYVVLRGCYQQCTGWCFYSATLNRMRGCYQQCSSNCFVKARILNDDQLRAQDDAFIQQHWTVAFKE